MNDEREKQEAESQTRVLVDSIVRMRFHDRRVHSLEEKMDELEQDERVSRYLAYQRKLKSEREYFGVNRDHVGFLFTTLGGLTGTLYTLDKAEVELERLKKEKNE